MNMKMMNVEMEFVAFDAQDVIATSGGFDWTGKNMIASKELLMQYNTENSEATNKFMYGDNAITTTNELPEYIGYAFNSFYYDTAISDPTHDQTDITRHGIYQSMSSPEYYWATEYQDILDWISANSNQ